MRRFIKNLLKGGADVYELEKRVAGLEQRANTAKLKRLSAVEGRTDSENGPSSFPIPNWWEHNYCEPTVALAIRDHCRPGNVVFDVGANAGALSMMMSRLVGPRGIVCAFEASPRIVDKTQYNLVNAGCTNVTVFHKAVWHTTDISVNLAAGSHLNDRIVQETTSMSVRTVALDDFAAAADLHPSFIKMDIEGAEFEALRGMARLLRDVRPVLVLEQSPNDMRCHALLTDVAYAAVDLATYRPIRSKDDFPAGTGIANVLFVPGETAKTSPYFNGPMPQPVMALSGAQFKRSANGDISIAEPFLLPAGRYIIRAEFSAEGTDNEIFAGVESNGEAIFRYHTYTRLMAESYSHWVIQLDRDSRIGPYLSFLRGSDPALRWNGVSVFRVPAFDTRPPVIIE